MPVYPEDVGVQEGDTDRVDLRTVSRAKTNGGRGEEGGQATDTGPGPVKSRRDPPPRLSPRRKNEIPVQKIIIHCRLPFTGESLRHLDRECVACAGEKNVGMRSRGGAAARHDDAPSLSGRRAGLIARRQGCTHKEEKQKQKKREKKKQTERSCRPLPCHLCTHHEHDASVDPVPRVPAGFAGEAVVRSEVALTLHRALVAGEGLHHREGEA